MEAIILPSKEGKEEYVLNIYQRIGRVPYPFNNTGEIFPQSFSDAVYKQPLYFNDAKLHQETLDMYAASPPLLLSNALKIDITHLTPQHIYYLQLYLQQQKYDITEINAKSIECNKNVNNNNEM